MKTPILAASLLLALAACTKSKSEKPADTDKPQKPAAGTPASGPDTVTLEQATAGLAGSGPLTAEIVTDLGTINCKLLPEAAPETVASFVGLARGVKAYRDPKSHEWVKRPFFDGLLFHRVIPEFMIQGGDPLSINPQSDMLGTGGPGFTLPDEVSPDLKFDKGGMLAMANRGPRTHSGGSQFFITEGPTPQLNGGYVIFGECDGVDIVKAIARVPRSGADRPDKPVTMKVTITR